ncbi:MAG: hypothetical protein Q4E77_00485 [Conchiformibius sp.]|nr:hypothetical protein [Conchiformibius sp.]
MKTTLSSLCLLLVLSACAADNAPPASGAEAVRQSCEQYYAHIDDMVKRGGKVKACIRARTQ